MPEFPTQPDEVTAAWLDRVLHEQRLLDSDGSVQSVVVEPVGSGVGLIGLVMRVRAEISDGSERTYVAKFAHPEPANRAIGMATRMYEREISFFNDIAPSVEVPMPHCIFAGVAPETGDSVVLLEDLVGYEPGDQGVGADADAVRRIIDAIAPLHAAWFGRTDQPVLDGHMRVGTSWVDGFMPGFDANWERGVELFADVIDPSIVQAAPHYARHVPDLMRRLGQSPQTLVHGDVRLDNIMFGTAPSHHPIVVIDWQAVMVSAPCQDIAYLMGQSLHVDERRAHERELIEHYHRRLVEHGCDGYPLDQIEADYELAALFVLAYAMIIGGLADGAPEAGVTLGREVLRRNAALVADRGLLDLIG